MTYRHMHTPAEVAAALRALADDLDATASLPALDLLVSLDIHVCRWVGTPADRIAAVDAFAVALVGVPGETERMHDGTWHHRLPCKRRNGRAKGVSLGVFTVAPAPITAVTAVAA